MSAGNVIEYTLKYQLAGQALLRFQRWQDERKVRARGDKDPLFAPPLRAGLRMKEVMSGNYLAGRYVNGVQPVAWVSSGAPIEVLRALGYYLVYPENHAALCGARRKVVEIAEEAESAGYSRDICSYARTDIGSVLSGNTPVGKLPKPDLLLVSNNICQTILNWWQVLSVEFQAPLVVIDTPFLYGEAEDHQVEFVRQQLEEMIPIAERVAGRSLSFARLKEVGRLAKEASELWCEVLDRCQHRPAPMTAFDGFGLMALVVALRGEAGTVQFYREVLAELDERIANGVGALKNERKRLLWDNLPIWYRVRWLSTLLAERGVNIVVSNYTYAWGELASMMDLERPLESAARVYLHPILNRSTGAKLASMKRMAKDFSLDGVLLHSDRSCKPYSLGQIDQRKHLVNDLGIPALLLEADHDDPRAFSEEQASNRLDAFLETLGV